MRARSMLLACSGLWAALFVGCADDDSGSVQGGASGGGGRSGASGMPGGGRSGGYPGAGDAGQDESGSAGQGQAGIAGLSEAGSSGESGSTSASGAGDAGSAGATGGTSGHGGTAGGMGGTAGAPLACTECQAGPSFVANLGICLTAAQQASPSFGCGSGFACLPPHAVPKCNGASCAIDHCEPNWADCDNNTANGCETDLRLPASCKTCGNVCAGGAVCTPSGCASTCSAGTTECSSSGSCVNLDTTAEHCGICSFSCSSGQACSGGSCVASCDPDVPNPLACGSSCQSCDANVQNGVAAACVSGQCQVLCAAGWGGQAQCSPVPYTTAIELAKNLNTPADIIADTNNVYWTDTGDSSVWQVSVNGGTKIAIATGQTNPAFMDINATHVYWITPTGINRVAKGGGTVEPVVTVSNPLGVAAAAGGSIYYVANGTFYSVATPGATPAPLGTPTTTQAPPGGILGNLGRLSSALTFADGLRLWSTSGVVSGGAGPFVLGRTGEYLRAGGLNIGPSTSIAKLPGNTDISGSYYFTGRGIAWYRGTNFPGLLVSTNQPRHLYAAGDAVYWTDSRSVFKALTCSQ